MKIEIGFFLGLFLGLWLIFIVLIDFFTSKDIVDAKRKINLTKITCEICGSIYFLYFKKEYWRCPFCGNINKR